MADDSKELTQAEPTQLSIVTRWLSARLSRLFAAFVLLTVVVAAFGVDWLAPHDPFLGDLASNLMGPFSSSYYGEGFYLLGTDMLGRDVLSAIIYGARISLLVSLATVLGAGLAGVGVGIVSGYAGGWVDEILMRIVDIQLAFPFIVLAIFIMYILGPGVTNVIIVLIISTWPIYARVARAEALRLRECDYVLAARAIGAGHTRILLRHILPNALVPLVVVAAFSVPQMIIFEAALSFLGLGIPASEMSWGSILAAGRGYITQAWWIVTFPGLAIMLTTVSINILGNELQEALGANRSGH